MDPLFWADAWMKHAPLASNLSALVFTITSQDTSMNWVLLSKFKCIYVWYSWIVVLGNASRVTDVEVVTKLSLQLQWGVIYRCTIGPLRFRFSLPSGVVRFSMSEYPGMFGRALLVCRYQICGKRHIYSYGNVRFNERPEKWNWYLYSCTLGIMESPS